MLKNVSFPIPQVFQEVSALRYPDHGLTPLVPSRTSASLRLPVVGRGTGGAGGSVEAEGVVSEEVVSSCDNSRLLYIYRSTFLGDLGSICF